MVNSDVLNQSKLKLQCNAAANLLIERNEYLTKLLEVFNNGLKLDDTGKSANAIKVQCNAYRTLINGMIIANNYDNYDHLLLAKLLESETLRGSIILPAIIEEKNSEMSCVSQAATCRSHGYSEPEPLLASKWFQAADNFDRQADNHRRAWKAWCKKRDHFDNVVAQSSALFQNSKQYREYIRQGLSDIAFSFANGTYNVSGWATWKQGIDKLNLAFHQEQNNLVNDLFSEDGYIDKNKLQAILEKDLEDVSPAEYQLILEISTMDKVSMADKFSSMTGRKWKPDNWNIIQGAIDAIGSCGNGGSIIKDIYSMGVAINNGDAASVGKACLKTGKGWMSRFGKYAADAFDGKSVKETMIGDFTRGGAVASLVKEGETVTKWQLFGKSFKNEMQGFVFKHADEAAGSAKKFSILGKNVKVATKWGGTILSVGANAISNIEEQKEDPTMTDVRVVEETVMETVVDIAIGAAATAAVTAIIGASAPAIVVGAAAAGVVWLANESVEYATSVATKGQEKKNLTEFVSDWFLDLGEKAIG